MRRHAPEESYLQIRAQSVRDIDPSIVDISQVQRIVNAAAQATSHQAYEGLQSISINICPKTARHTTLALLNIYHNASSRGRSDWYAINHA